MVPGSEFNADFSNRAPLSLANYQGQNGQFLTELSYLTSRRKVNVKGINFSYEKPFIDGPLIK